MPVYEKQVRFGPFQLDTQCGQLRKDGIGLKLQGQPVQILEMLLEKPGELVTREELRQRLWPSDTFVDFDHSLNTAIKRLRQALGDDAETPKYIETIPKRGYRFSADLLHAQADQHGAPSLTTVDENAERVATALADPAITAGKKSDSLLVWRVVAIAAVALVALGAAFYWITQPPPMPRIVGSHALTKSGFRKTWDFQSRVVTDGTTVYFQEARPSRVATVRVSTGGGEVSELSIEMGNVSLRDISKDGSQLLFTRWDPDGNHYNAWVQPLPYGVPRLVIKDARWPTWTPDGSKILFARGGGQELWRANADGTKIERLSEFSNISGIAVSPDGEHIRIADGRSGVLWETDPRSSRRIILSEPVGPGVWSADGRYFFFLNWDGDRFNLWARSETRHWWKRTPPTRELTFGPLSIGAPAISRDGKHIYAVGREPHGELSAYDQRRGKFVPYLGGISACFVDFSRDGQWIAYVSYPDGMLWRSRLDGSERRQLTVQPLLVVNPRWSPDGKLIAFTDGSGGDRRLPFLGTRRLYIVSADGGGPMLLPTSEDQPLDPTWSPDGKSIAYSTGHGPPWGKPADIWILDLNKQQSTKVPGAEGLWSPRWSPDGHYLAALGFGRLWLFSFATQKWSDLKLQAQWPNWSRDGKFLYVAQPWSSLVRIAVSDHKVEPVASIAGFPSTAVLMPFGWYGLTPDNIPITTRETGIEEIYAFDLEYE